MFTVIVPHFTASTTETRVWRHNKRKKKKKEGEKIKILNV